MSAVMPVLRKEMRDTVRNRWFAAYALTFSVLAATLAYAGSARMGGLAFEGYDRVSAGLLNLCLFLVPLVALVMGSTAIVGERERGMLLYLLSHPVSLQEVLLGKFLGLALAVTAGTLLGFGLAGLVIGVAAPVAGLGTYLLFVALVVGLGVAMLSVAMLVSVLAATRAHALVVATLLWFGLVVFYDLAIMAVTAAVGMGSDSLLIALLMNPVEVARILTVLALEPDLEVLGPLGGFMMEHFGTAGSALILLGALIAWVVGPLAAALVACSRQEL